ncbi:serine hydrolase domain-containing protein [Shewanella sp. Isolate8]|uniref:serine hydrolase domain-containing protein n=1 Tax=Shewanella sp. Isolate8 TaxID=2908529 RepID=UPI001EFC7007|nr:serine hydrolase domain-containing protein [Shewanella sp. Isolate8]MCG9747559.1 beta-lactamase family protein [Shewanella sp. Isolate8]
MKLSHFTLTMVFLALAGCSVSNQESTAANQQLARQQVFESSIRSIDDDGNSSASTNTLEARMKAYGVPAVSIAVFDNNQIIWSKGYGKPDIESNQGVTRDTLFQAASISKAVTSVAAFKMIQNGNFELNEDVNLKLKRWHVPENQFTQQQKVTPSRIMSHTSGLNVSGFEGYTQNQTIPSLVQILQGSSLSNSPAVKVFQKPGESEYYSGGGMTVLQLLMEDTSAQPFSQLMQQLILKPLNMSQSSFELALPNELQSQIAKGYDSQQSMIEGGYHLYPEKAAAGLWSTPTDLAKFMIALGKAYRGEDETLLSQQSAKTMLTRVPGAGGTGIGIDGEADAFRFRHSGGNAGYTCYAVSFANSGRGFVVMTNSDNGFQLIHEISRAVSETYGWPPMWMRE